MISRSLEDGKENWRFKYPDAMASRPGFSPDRLVFQTGSGVVFCLDQADGSPKWISKQAGRHELSMLGAGRPLIIGDKVYLGMLDGFMVALKLDDGGLVWKKEVFTRPITSDIDYQPLADEETIYAGSLEGVCALSRVSGKVFWCVKQDLAGDYALDPESVYALTKDKQLLVIDKITGVVDQKLPLKKSLLEKWDPDKLLWMSKDEQRLTLVLAGSVWEWKADAEAPKRVILYPDRTMRAAELQGDRLYLITSKGYLVSRELK